MIRSCRGVLAAAAVMSALSVTASPASAQRVQQVLIEPRFAYVGTEFSAGLGIDWRGVTGFYDSTGPQAPADGRASGASGFFSFGGTGWLSSGLGGVPLGSVAQIGRIDVGIGLTVNPFFGGSRTPIAVERHNSGTDDVTLRHNVSVATDLKVTARVPFRFQPAISSSGIVTLNLEPEIGLSLSRTTTTLHSDQFQVNGTDESRRESGTSVGFFWGVGLSMPIAQTELPLIGSTPMLGRLFYRARHVGGTTLALPSVSGFTEFGQTKGFTGHQVGAELVIFLTPRTVRTTGDP